MCDIVLSSWFIDQCSVFIFLFLYSYMFTHKQDGSASDCSSLSSYYPVSNKVSYCHIHIHMYNMEEVK